MYRYQFIIARELRAINGKSLQPHRFGKASVLIATVSPPQHNARILYSARMREERERIFEIKNVIRNYLARPCARKDEPVRPFPSSPRIRGGQRRALPRLEIKPSRFGKQLTNYIIISFCTDPKVYSSRLKYAFARAGYNWPSTTGVESGPARFLGSGPRCYHTLVTLHCRQLGEYIIESRRSWLGRDYARGRRARARGWRGKYWISERRSREANNPVLRFLSAATLLPRGWLIP